MGARSSGREAALQMLFALEAAGAQVSAVVYDYWREFPNDVEGKPYSESLVRNVSEERAALDERIGKASVNWRIERMTRVDRNVLRIATWELVHDLDTPRAVILDEAVELAKKFGTEDSGAFVNGVLSKIADDAGRAVET